MAKKNESNLRGPGRPVTVGERIPLGLRVTKELKQKLNNAVFTSGRSQSQEAEFRLEQTFNAANTLFDALDLAYGRRWTGIVLAMAHAAQLTGTRSMMLNHWNFEACEDWVLDPFAFDQAVKAINAILEAFRPEGKITVTPQSGFARYPKSMFEDLGRGCALDILQLLAVPNDRRGDTEIVRAISQRVGNLRSNGRDAGAKKPDKKCGK